MEFAKLPTILIWVKNLARELVEKGTEQLSTHVKTGDLKNFVLSIIIGNGVTDTLPRPSQQRTNEAGSG